MATYTIQHGDTLSAIARRFGVTVAALAAANQIADPNHIRTGQVLQIPGIEATLPSSGPASTSSGSTSETGPITGPAGSTTPAGSGTTAPAATKPEVQPQLTPLDPRLAAYPRPPDDNGWGIHWGQDLRDRVTEQYLPIAQQMKLKWVLVVSQSPEQTGRISRYFKEAGIMPVIRPLAIISRALQLPWAEHVRAAQDAGFARPYIQILNEPDDEREWPGKHVPANNTEIWADIWNRVAGIVREAGGLPGIQSLDSEQLRVAVRTGDKNLWREGWFSGHPYALNHPPRYPLDTLSEEQVAALTDDQIADEVARDDASILTHYAFARVFQQELGFVPPFIQGEGGFPIDCGDDNRYPKISADLHAQYQQEWFSWFGRRTDSLGRPLPDYYFAICPWIFFGDWWYWLPGCEKTVETISRMPALARTFAV